LELFFSFFGACLFLVFLLVFLVFLVLLVFFLVVFVFFLVVFVLYPLSTALTRLLEQTKARQTHGK
jgi:hypothetical protein